MMSHWGIDPPQRLPVELFARAPDHLRRLQRSAWAHANFGDRVLAAFLEGPAFDRSGRLHVVDIPFGRILRIDRDGTWTLVLEYDGWPNGLKFHRDGRAFIADYRRGILEWDTATGAITPVVEHVRSEGLRGCNDLTYAHNGDLFFTDQGQSGLHDPSGRVFRLAADGTLRCLLDNVPSPNGLVLNLAQNQLMLAVTRDNAVWRVPLTPDGGVTKVGAFLRLSGGLAGPDGLALDAEDGLVVAHPGTAVLRFDRLGTLTHWLDSPRGEFLTNIAFDPLDPTMLYVVSSERAEILRARMPVAGAPLFAHGD